MTPAATPSRKGRIGGFSAIATSWRWRKIGKTKAGRKMPSVIARRAGEPAGEVADEGGEDDQRRGEDAAEREAVEELRRR